MNIYIWIPDKTGNGPDHLYINGENISSDENLKNKWYNLYGIVSNSIFEIYNNNNNNNKILKQNDNYFINYYTNEKDIMGRLLPVIIIIEDICQFNSKILTKNIENTLKKFPIIYSNSELDELIKIIYNDTQNPFSKYKIFRSVIAILIILLIIFLIIKQNG